MTDQKGLQKARSEFMFFFSKNFSEEKYSHVVNSNKLANPLELTKKDLQVLYRIKQVGPAANDLTKSRRRLTLQRPQSKKEDEHQRVETHSIQISRQPIYNHHSQPKKIKFDEIKAFDLEVMQEIERFKTQSILNKKLARCKSAAESNNRNQTLLKQNKSKSKRHQIGHQPYYLNLADKCRDISRAFSPLVRTQKGSLKQDDRSLSLFQFQMMNAKQKNNFKIKVNSIRHSFQQLSQI